jgi:hypothetical protein
MDDFFEAGVGCEVVDVVAAEGQAAFFALDVTEQRAPDDDAFEPAIDNDTGGRQCRVPPAAPFGGPSGLSPRAARKAALTSL